MKKLMLGILVVLLICVMAVNSSPVQADILSNKTPNPNPHPTSSEPELPPKPIKCNPKPNSVLYDAPNGIQVAILKNHPVLIYEFQGNWMRVERVFNETTSLRGWVKRNSCT